MSEHNCEKPKIEVNESKIDLSRRKFLSAVGAAAASVGLAGLASSAEAATKKYKVCSTKDVKVGGATRFQIQALGGAMILITQPKAGVFRAFNAACTHAGIPLGTVVGKDIVCSDGHNAAFNLDTGKVTRGPAQMPLKKYTVTKSGTTLYINA